MSIAIPLAVIVTSVASFFPSKPSRRRHSSTGSKKAPPAAGKKRKPKKQVDKRTRKHARRSHGVVAPLGSDEIRVSKDGSFAKFGHMWWTTHGKKLLEQAKDALAERDIDAEPNVVTGVVLQLAVPDFAWAEESLRTDAVRRLMQTVHLLVSASMTRGEQRGGSAMANAIIERQRRMTRPEPQTQDQDDEEAEDDEGEDDESLEDDGDGEGEDEVEDEAEDPEDVDGDGDGDGEDAANGAGPELAQVLPHPSSRMASADAELADVAAEEDDDEDHGDEPQDVPVPGSRRGRTRRGSRGGR